MKTYKTAFPLCKYNVLLINLFFLFQFQDLQSKYTGYTGQQVNSETQLKCFTNALSKLFHSRMRPRVQHGESYGWERSTRGKRNYIVGVSIKNMHSIIHTYFSIHILPKITLILWKDNITHFWFNPPSPIYIFTCIS